MGNDIQIFQIFKFEGDGNRSEIRTFVDDKGEPWFVAKDIAEALGYVNIRDAVFKHCKHTITGGVAIRDAIGREQKMTIIPESDVYRLIVRSKLPSAERFEKWVFDEVLPSLRKTGSYSTDRQYKIPKSFSEALYLAAEQTEELEKANAELEVARPKAALVDAHYGAALSSITKFVRTLKGVNINRNING